MHTSRETLWKPTIARTLQARHNIGRSKTPVASGCDTATTSGMGALCLQPGRRQAPQQCTAASLRPALMEQALIECSRINNIYIKKFSEMFCDLQKANVRFCTMFHRGFPRVVMQLNRYFYPISLEPYCAVCGRIDAKCNNLINLRQHSADK